MTRFSFEARVRQWLERCSTCGSTEGELSPLTVCSPHGGVVVLLCTQCRDGESGGERLMDNAWTPARSTRRGIEGSRERTAGPNPGFLGWVRQLLPEP
jgi:hypothetical protein